MPAMATTVSTTVLKSVPLFASFPDEQLRTLVRREQQAQREQGQ